jgi:predicted N-acetyltransferase YhbS
MNMEHDLVVTCFSSAHAEAVSRLIRDSLPESLAEATSKELEAGAEAYTKEQLIRHMNERLTYIAVYHHQVVGVIVLDGADTGREVEVLCVSPDFRDEGVGAMLVETAEKRAGELGVKQISVSPKLKDNGFFRKMGYGGAVPAKALA